MRNGTLSRRDFLKASGAGIAGLGLFGIYGCGGGEQGGSGGEQGGSASGELSFQVWGTNEEQAFRKVIKRYQSQNPDVKINLELVPYDRHYERLDTRLSAGNAPDLARIQYQQIGRYASQGAVIDLSEYLDDGYGDAFTPALWQASLYEDKPYAIPHHTDTMAIFYNTDIFNNLGIEVPQKLEDSWTWDEFMQVSRRLKEEGGVDFPFAMSWTGESVAYRWVWFLFQHGGSLLTEDLSGPNVDNPTGIETIAFNQSWFNEGLVPPNTSIKSSESTEQLFANGTTAMMLNGEWIIPFLDDTMTAGWDVTYMIRDVEMASDLGGTTVAVTKDSQNPEAAADFLKFLCSKEQMAEFCADGLFIPARKSLVEEGIDFRIYPEEVALFVEQSTTIPTQMAKEQTIPQFSSVNQVLADQLEAAFKTGQSPEATASNIASGIQEILG